MYVLPSPLERSYKPRILRHYPDITSWSHFNPEALSRLCLPQGLRSGAAAGVKSSLLQVLYAE